ncbi:hypothetical protein VTO42DRAFT_2304 [Malbranchea cinnamomea]
MQSHRYSFKTQPIANPEAIVGGTGNYRFTVLTDGLLRYEWAEDGLFEDRASVLAVNRRLPVPEYRVKESNDTLEIITTRFHLTYDKRPFSPSGLTAVVKGAFWEHGSVWRYGESCESLGGTARTLDGADGRIPLGPGVVSRKGYATLDDSQSMLFDDEQVVGTRRPGSRVDGYLFAYGHDYAAAVKAFYAISGSQPLLPRWALGNWWSRYYAYRADEYLELMDRFQEKRIPMSVAVIDMDWHLVNGDPRVAEAGVTGWTGYTWNRELFPDPEGFLAELHRRNLKTSLNDHPADGVQRHEDSYHEMAVALNHDTTHGDGIPFDITNRRFLDAYFDILHRRLENQGVDLWWVDWQQGPHSRIPGIDPLWVLNHFHFMDSGDGQKRPMTFSRYAGPGSHRYPVGFSGDSHITWDSLHFQPEFTATASNIGYGWWSHDIGGHMFGERDDELLIRWVQYGVFSPIMRLHSSRNPWNLKEPWNLEPSFEKIMIEFLRLRHRLVPYLYTANEQAALKDTPLVQPMYWLHPNREEAYQYKNQYYFGSELMVVPITAPQNPKLRLSQVRAWFPPGRYVDIFNGTVYDGNREMWISRRLSDFPVFAREGAIIPLDAAAEPQNGCENPAGFEILVVVGADGQFEIVEDDGTGASAACVDFVRTPIVFNQAAGTVEIGPSTGSGLRHRTRSWNVRFVGYGPPKKICVYVDGSERDVVVKQESSGCLVAIGDCQTGSRITVELGESPELNVTEFAPRIGDFLLYVQMNLELKEKIWTIVSDIEAPRTVVISRLCALDLDTSFLHALMEYIVADSRERASWHFASLSWSTTREQI